MHSLPDPEGLVQVSALQAGHLTLPERFFVNPASDVARKTVPSLSFLIEHVEPRSGKVTRIVFDLGLRRPSNYPIPVQNHIKTRQPLSAEPDIVKSLEAGGLTPDHIDFVIYSHIHWDHIGDPRMFGKSTFVTGPGTSSLLDGSNFALRGGHSFFEIDLLRESQAIEILKDGKFRNMNTMKEDISFDDDIPNFSQSWEPRGSLPRTMDIFQDGSVLLVDAPGHLPGHMNILARTGQDKYVYLAGDACHDRRIMTREKEIGEWHDEHGHICCIHANRKEAERTIERIKQLELDGVEVIFAHDVEWEQNPENQKRFFGACSKES